MYIFVALFIALASTAAAQNAQNNAKIVCFYDSKSYYREDSGKFLTADLEHSLSECTHILYGSAKIDPAEYKVKSNDPDLDTDSGKMNYKAVTALKKRFPGLHVLLSIGNWADVNDGDKSDKYLELLRDPDNRGKFISSARAFIAKYGFDGIDLGWQFPLIRVKQRGTLGSFWHKVKKTFGYSKGSKDLQADEHRAGFTALVKQLKLALRPDGYLLTASAIPHTNYTTYWDVREVSPYLDAIHLQAFDFLTPESKITPEVADYSAPLFATYDRNPTFNVDYQVRWFLDNGAPPNKLVLGVPSYGRTWQLDSNSAASGVPPLEANGEGAEGHLTHKPGVLSYPEVCTMSQNPNNHGTKGLLRKVNDPSKKLGTYAFRSETSDRHGIWVSYEEPETIRQKAEYARLKNLGGIALYDLSMDDFRGICDGKRYPLLKAAKAGLL